MLIDFSSVLADLASVSTICDGIEGVPTASCGTDFNSALRGRISFPREMVRRPSMLFRVAMSAEVLVLPRSVVAWVPSTASDWAVDSRLVWILG